MADKPVTTKHPAKSGDAIQLAPDRPRRAILVFNDSDGPLLVRFGDEPASGGEFGWRIKPGEGIGPFGVSYDGAVSGTWEKIGSPPKDPKGWARVTEWLQET